MVLKVAVFFGHSPAAQKFLAEKVLHNFRECSENQIGIYLTISPPPFQERGGFFSWYNRGGGRFLSRSSNCFTKNKVLQIFETVLKIRLTIPPTFLEKNLNPKKDFNPSLIIFVIQFSQQK